jgi:hypothetical protein
MHNELLVIKYDSSSEETINGVFLTNSKSLISDDSL